MTQAVWSRCRPGRRRPAGRIRPGSRTKWTSGRAAWAFCSTGISPRWHGGHQQVAHRFSPSAGPRTRPDGQIVPSVAGSASCGMRTSPSPRPTAPGWPRVEAGRGAGRREQRLAQRRAPREHAPIAAPIPIAACQPPSRMSRHGQRRFQESIDGTAPRGQPGRRQSDQQRAQDVAPPAACVPATRRPTWLANRYDAAPASRGGDRTSGPSVRVCVTIRCSPRLQALQECFGPELRRPAAGRAALALRRAAA